MHPNNDLNPENFKIFSIEELSVIAYNLYLRDEKTLKKHWKALVKQIICKSLQDNNISRSSSAIEITLVLNQDCKRSNNLLINKNLLCSLAPEMLKAHEHIGWKIAQKFKKNSKSTSLAVVEKIFDKTQGIISKIKQRYQGYVSSQKIIQMYEEAINIELNKRYQEEQEEAKKHSNASLLLAIQNWQKRFPNSATFQNLITESKNEETNTEKLSNESLSSALKNDGQFQKFFTDKENERLNQLITQQK